MDFSDLFDLSTDDYAVDLLSRVFGGVVEFVSGEGGSLTDGTLLTNLISIFNTACLLAALVVGSYTTYVLVFDTAADGKTFGNQSDTKYTIVRILVGAIAFVPIQGGLTVAQLVLVWLTVQGSALGDVAWRAVADGALRDEPVLAATDPLSETDFLVSQQFSNALYALAHGELCQREMERLATLASNPAADVNRQATLETDTSTRMGLWGAGTSYTNYHRKIYYSDVGGSYGEADNLCGSISHRAEVLTAATTGAGDFAERVGSAVVLNRFNAADTAITTNLVPAAEQIANRVFAGERNRSQIETIMRDAVAAAFTNYMSGVSGGGITSGEYEDLHEALLDEVDTLGWPFAMSWHRGITMASYSANSAATELQIYANPENSIDDYFSGLGAYLSGRSSGVDRGMFVKVVDDFGYLNQFHGYAQELGTHRPSATAAVTNGGDADGGGLLYSLYQVVLEVFTVTDGGATAAYLDPMADVIAVGKQITTVGGTIMAAGAVTEVGGAVFGGVVGGAVTGYVADYLLYPVGWFLLIAGFVLISIIPAIPLVYFFAAVLSWLLLCIEAMFAVPLSVLAYFAPARDGTLIGPANKIILTLFGIALRPIFTIIGFIASLILMRIGMDFLFLLFSGFLGFMTAGGSWFTIIIMIGLIFMYIVTTLILIMQASSLIIELGDGAMAGAGIMLSNIGKLNIGDNVSQTARPTGRVLNEVSNIGRVTKNAGAAGGKKLSGAAVKRLSKG
ncbi:DotA/TraY family protein [Phaeobacter piscinae]|uniref:DotA/TraY family protein n=1 Tax=Phaeobacter piscinae TaxID=1580596 RepID=UPI00058D18D6|nr:DotA/TraY family protein [Phaeobacter piscinae]UTS82775.1 hypothetical protein OL67_003885 [Phaeobacter piscinae]